MNGAGSWWRSCSPVGLSSWVTSKRLVSSSFLSPTTWTASCGWWAGSQSGSTRARTAVGLLWELCVAYGGSRPVTVSGALLLTLGFILTSLSPNVPLMIIFIVAFAGFGAALVWFSCFSVMASYFKEKYQLAVGISMMATPIGLMVYGPMTQLLLDTYGWRATMLLLGGVSFHLVACALLVRRNPSSSSPDTEQYQEISVTDDEESKEEWGEGRYESITETSDDEGRANSDFHNSGVKECCQRFTAALDFAVLVNVRFLLQTAAHFTFSFSYSGYVVFMVSQGQISGLSVHQASFLPIALGIGNIIGRALPPLLQVIGVVPSMTCWAFFGSSLTGASMIANVSISPFIGQFAMTGLTGIGIGVLYQAIDVLLRFLSTDDRLVNLMGWQGVFVGVAGVLGGLTSGWIYEWTGSFSPSFYVYGGVTFLCILLFLADAVYAKRRSH
ncbi:monocarboxylate transporter 13-like [Patiria miniata]|uniref:Uncharacterized protein n=1 Tax=Patiria miniata TaxID=46514 RepID=A0A913ZUX5_PATMI|nr:monocarboxylate transporter 13-like [Patiria miniata]